MINVQALRDSSNFKDFMDRVREDLEDVRLDLELEKNTEEVVRKQGEVRGYRKILELLNTIESEQSMNQHQGQEE